MKNTENNKIKELEYDLTVEKLDLIKKKETYQIILLKGIERGFKKDEIRFIVNKIDIVDADIKELDYELMMIREVFEDVLF